MIHSLLCKSSEDFYKGLVYRYGYGWASLGVQLVKHPLAIQETLVQFLGQKDPLEKGYVTHSSILGLPRQLGQ